MIAAANHAGGGPTIPAQLPRDPYAHDSLGAVNVQEERCRRALARESRAPPAEGFGTRERSQPLRLDDAHPGWAPPPNQTGRPAREHSLPMSHNSSSTLFGRGAHQPGAGGSVVSGPTAHHTGACVESASSPDRSRSTRWSTGDHGQALPAQSHFRQSFPTEANADSGQAFVPCSSFQGLRKGYTFRGGPNGLGYYAQSAESHALSSYSPSKSHSVAVARDEHGANAANAHGRPTEAQCHSGSLPNFLQRGSSNAFTVPDGNSLDERGRPAHNAIATSTESVEDGVRAAAAEARRRAFEEYYSAAGPNARTFDELQAIGYKSGVEPKVTASSVPEPSSSSAPRPANFEARSVQSSGYYRPAAIQCERPDEVAARMAREAATRNRGSNIFAS